MWSLLKRGSTFSVFVAMMDLMVLLERYRRTTPRVCDAGRLAGLAEKPRERVICVGRNIVVTQDHAAGP